MQPNPPPPVRSQQPKPTPLKKAIWITVLAAGVIFGFIVLRFIWLFDLETAERNKVGARYQAALGLDLTEFQEQHGEPDHLYSWHDFTQLEPGTTFLELFHTPELTRFSNLAIYLYAREGSTNPSGAFFIYFDEDNEAATVAYQLRRTGSDSGGNRESP